MKDSFPNMGTGQDDEVQTLCPKTYDEFIRPKDTGKLIRQIGIKVGLYHCLDSEEFPQLLLSRIDYYMLPK